MAPAMSTQTRVTKPKPNVIRRVVYLLSTLTFIIVGILLVRRILRPPGTSKEDQRLAQIANSSPLRSGLPGYPKPSFEQLDNGESLKDPDSDKYSRHDLTVAWQVTDDRATTFRSWAALLRADGWIIDATFCTGGINWTLEGLKSGEPKMGAHVSITRNEVTFDMTSIGARSEETFVPIKRFDSSCPTLP
jgi:hypothetical protein